MWYFSFDKSNLLTLSYVKTDWQYRLLFQIQNAEREIDIFQFLLKNGIHEILEQKK